MSKRFLAFVAGLLVLVLAVGATTAAADTPPGVQTADQSATSGQQAVAASGAAQVQPSNTNISVRVLSPGNDGNVTQTNSVSSTGTATNSNDTSQNASQTQGGAGGIQTSTQSAGNWQSAGALSQALQFAPSNTNLDIRVGSGGNGGSVTQANTASSDAKASNDNDTHQDADQSQAGGASPCGCDSAPAIQTSDQSAESEQKAIALSAAEQKDAKNVNLPIRVGSSGNDGSVKQTNDVSSDATAKNDNDLRQSTDQDVSGGSGTAVQTADQSAANEQKAAAASTAVQDKPKNVNISVRVLSDGNGGNVTQTNSVDSSAKATNDNDTHQSIDQDPTGASKDGHDCGCAGSTGIQTAKQGAESTQGAAALSTAEQRGASNTNTPIRVGSSGNDGNVFQSNDVSSEAKASNDNDTTQRIDQDLAGGKDGKDGHDCGCDSSKDIQTAKQGASSEQGSLAVSHAVQDFGKSECGCPSGGNTNTPVRVGSSGNDGNVFQANDVSSEAKASNDNDTHQSIDQDSHGSSGTGVQTADQWAGNAQLAAAASAAEQKGASNKNAPIRVGSDGNGGTVAQFNGVDSDAKATNDNDTRQSIDQDPTGSSNHDCGCGSTDIQTAKQGAESEQGAFAISKADQFGASNKNAPVRVKSDGNDGSVFQANAVSSDAKASNDNDTHQDIDQDLHGGSSGKSAQTADQWAGNAQLAGAASFATQKDASNKNAPIRVKSDGNDGVVAQFNGVDSDAHASNDNDTRQSIDQDPTSGSKDGHDCGCGSKGIQVADQKALNAQGATAISAAGQFGAENKNAPVRVKSDGNDGNVFQANAVSSDAKASNDNDTHQDVDQDLHGGSGLGVQIAYQTAANEQLAKAASAAEQKGASNTNAPLRVFSSGNGWNVAQANLASSEAKADNDNDTHQKADQDLSSRGGCGCDGSIGIQALGQKSVSSQGALAVSEAVQDFGKSECGCHAGGNSNSPVRVYSGGNDGSVAQINAVDSKAKASNDNSTDQHGDQSQSGTSGIGIQALGQEAANYQTAAAFSGAFQFGASNRNNPVRVYSGGNDGSVLQVNSASSDALAANRNRTRQDGHQTLRGSGGCGCSSPIGVQALGQSAANGQLAAGLSGAAQLAPANANGGSSVYSGGNAGFTGQFNNDDSFAGALNRDRAEMLADQRNS
jgi:hypothetical protein